MCYEKKWNYEIVPEESYEVIRNCSGCGCKSHYKNTNRFRVNANGNRIDVWLIYQCEKCKHTWNLTIYERQRPEEIPSTEYQKFLSNDSMTAMKYGTNRNLFMKNHGDIDWKNHPYQIVGEITEGQRKAGNQLLITNPYDLKIRTDKVIAEVLGISRSQEKELEKNASIVVETENFGKRIKVWIHNDIS
ncbi:DUF1062 domain-containing protein [Anaerosporobacter faecicola]|uniref:DUF1062 domain-containing protein n=1 Tax=Anaerosporobacter faecicola TaxID=2718714 RepID=UPI00143BB5BD|nr:DUF1062 domain-containing protein [Anaerosporobacter faecicola]